MRSKGSWEIAIDVGRDPATGKRLQRWATVRGTKRDAERRLTELAVEVEKRTYVKSAHNLTLGDYLTDWLQTHAELHCRPRTAEGYRFIVNCHLILGMSRIAAERFDKFLSPWLGQENVGK